MNQDVILAVVAALAGVCLVVGLAQALGPPPRRRRGRRRQVVRAALHRRLGEPAPGLRSDLGDRVPTAATTSVDVEAPARGEPSPPPSRRRSAPVFRPRSRPAAPEAAPAAPAVPAEPAPSPAEVERPVPGPPEVELPLEQCRSLYEGKQYQEVIAAAEPALQRALGELSGIGPRAQEVAGLWSLLALSRQALGDEEDARSAFEEAMHAAPEADRPTYQQQLAALATSVGRRLLARAEEIGDAAGEERIGVLRQAMLWLRQGLAEAPGDGELSSALERARRGLRASYAQTVTALIQRQEFRRARRLIRDALADEELPAEGRANLNELLSQTFAGEIGQLSASAVRALEDEREGEALTFLERAEGLLTSVPAEALTAKRRDEVTRRLWWGYSKLGMRRVEAGEHEEAIEPLFRALRIGETSPERQQETHEGIVRALLGVAEGRAALINQLVKDGKRSAAVEEGERLKAVLRESLELGLSQQELSPVIAKARLALESIDQGTGS